MSISTNVHLCDNEVRDFQTTPSPPPPTPDGEESDSELDDLYVTPSPTPPIECNCTNETSDGFQCPVHQKNKTLFYIEMTGEYLHPRLH